MKKVLEFILCVLHPIAVVLIWISLIFRTKMSFLARLAWGVACIVPFIPFLFVLTDHEFL